MQTLKGTPMRGVKFRRIRVARFLDPENDSVQLDTIQKAAAIVGKRLTIIFEDLTRPAA